MGLFDKIKIRLYEVKKEPPIKSGSVDPADQQGDFVKNERDKKKIMRKLEPKSKQTELNLGNTKTTNTPKSTKRTLKGRPLGSKTKPKGETYKQLTTGSERQRQRKDIKRQFKTRQPISDLKKAKKYAIGEYPKIGGGERISPKSKGTGASTGRTRIPPATVGGKSKGTTLRKVNITKPIKQSEVSKKAKVFTQKIDKKKIVKDADRLVRKAEKGNKKARKKIFKVLDKKFKKLSPADQEIEAKKMYDIQKKMGRTFNPKTGNFEGPDTEFQKSISKIKDSKGKRITSGPVSVTAGPNIRKRVEKIRDTRATKAGMPDPFKSTTKFSQKEFDKSFKSLPKSVFDKSFKAKGRNLPGGAKAPQIPTFPDPFGKGDTKGQMNVKGLEAKAFKKTQPRDVKLPKSFTDFSKKLKTFKTNVAKTSSITPTIGVNQADVSRKAKKFSQDISNKVQMRGGATNIPAQPTKPPKKYNIPIDDRPGKLVQGRDFPSKKAYDAKIAKQVKILRDKADRLRTKQIKLAKTTPTKGTPEYETRRTGVKKIGRRMKQRRITADALERSLKRQGVKGPTGMLPVVSGAGANKEVKAFGNKTFKQFYKDAGVSKREPIKPIKPIEQIKDTTKKKRIINKKYSSNTGNLGNTAFNQNMRGIYKKIPKALRSKTLYRIGKAVAKNPYVGTAVGIGLGGYAAYKGIKALTNKPKVRTLKTSDLKSKKTGSTVTHGTGEFKGKPVRFDALGLGFTKKKGVEKKKPTYQDFQSGKYTFK